MALTAAAIENPQGRTKSYISPIAMACFSILRP